MPADPEQIACWQRLSPDETTSGRLAAEDVAALDAIGVRHVINLALADSPGALADEAELLAARGIRYTHIPVPDQSRLGGFARRPGRRGRAAGRAGHSLHAYPGAVRRAR
jgi:hypothetical protein